MEEEQIKNEEESDLKNVKDDNHSASDTNELEELKKKCEEYLNGWKRAKADYLNLKKEISEKQKDWLDFIQAGLLLEILPLINNLKIALSHVPEEARKENWVIGFEHIYKQFVEFLKKLEIEEIKTVGEKFNPEFHEAISQEENTDVEDQIILKEIGPGYKMNEKVIVPAKVIVNVKNTQTEHG